MRCKTMLFAVALFGVAAAAGTTTMAADVRHFSFAYDQPHTTAYGIAADTFANKLAELSHGTLVIDQFPGAQLGQEPQVLQKLRTGDVDFAITSTANSATVQPESGVFSIHFVFRSEDHLKKALADPAVVAAFRDMMHELVPDASEISVLVNPSNPNAEPQLVELRAAAGMLRLSLTVLKASTEDEIAAAFASLAQEAGRALLVAGDTFFNSRRNQLVERAARFAVPAIYEFREYTATGGLMSYASRLADSYHQAGVYTGRIFSPAQNPPTSR